MDWSWALFRQSERARSGISKDVIICDTLLTSRQKGSLGETASPTGSGRRPRREGRLECSAGNRLRLALELQPQDFNSNTTPRHDTERRSGGLRRAQQPPCTQVPVWPRPQRKIGWLSNPGCFFSFTVEFSLAEQLRHQLPGAGHGR